MITHAQSNETVASNGEFPQSKEEKKKLSLYREDVVVRGKDGNYPAVRATFDALTDAEKSELFRLVKDLGFEKEQLIGALENYSRNTIIVLIFNKDRTRVIGTGQVNFMKEFGAANKDLGVSRLGTFGISYAFVEENYRGRHLSKELLKLRLDMLKNGYFNKWVQQTNVKDLKLANQKLDGKPVTKKMLLEATRKENTVLYCDLRDEKAHFGRAAEAAEAAGMEVTGTSKENMKPYAQMNVMQEDDYLVMYAYTGVTVNSVGGRKMLSRKNTTQPVYFYGPKKLREQIAKQVSERLLAAGAQYNEGARYYHSFPADLAWKIIDDLSHSNDYKKTLDQPNTGEITTQAKEQYAKGKKLHMLTIKAYDTHRLSMGFPTEKRKKRSNPRRERRNR